ncbi:MAG: hypothetical protein ACOYJ2_04055 [Rickettsiales bacterium]
MSAQEQYYAPDIAAKAVIEFTKAYRQFSDVDYAVALISDPRMSSNRGHFASCGINMREVKSIKNLLPAQLPLMEVQRKAIEFLDSLDHEQEIMNA